MNSIKMSYRGFCFDVNPKSVKAQYKRAESVSLIPHRRAKSHELCEIPLTLSGSGKFYGKDAKSQMQMLLSVYKKSGAAYLFSPVLPPVKAYFTSLDFCSGAGQECIEYSFSFKEAETDKKGSFDFGYTLAKAGENLFDISNRTNTEVEKIVDLNGFEDPFEVREGDRVWLK